jgi:hypothetical protein
MRSCEGDDDGGCVELDDKIGERVDDSYIHVYQCFHKDE